MDLHETFEKFTDEFLKFERVENKMSSRPDLHAFLMLEFLVHGTNDIISASEHDEIFLETDCEALALVISEDEVRTLVRCGVLYDYEYDSLYMFT